jgi:hypothetical protein
MRRVVTAKERRERKGECQKGGQSMVNWAGKRGIMRKFIIRVFFVSLLISVFILTEVVLVHFIKSPTLPVEEARSLCRQIDEVFERVEPSSPGRLIALAALMRIKIEAGGGRNFEGLIPKDEDLPLFDSPETPLVDYWGNQYLLGTFPVVSLSQKPERRKILYYRRIGTRESVKWAKEGYDPLEVRK